MMKKRLVILLLMLVIVPLLKLKAATAIDFKTVDELTYRFYTEAKWDSVIYYGKLGLQHDIDFYYLRTRLGLAYYAQHRYIPAATHLVKAREFDAGDPFIADYLYYCYIFTNRTEEAQLLIPQLTEVTRKAVNGKRKVIDLAAIESGYVISSNNTLKENPYLMGSDSIYGETDEYGNYLYENVKLKFQVTNRLRLLVAYNYLNFSKNKYVQYLLYTIPKYLFDTSFQYRINQHELYAGFSWYLNNGWRILPAVHMIHVSYPATSVSYTSDAYQFKRTDTSFLNVMAGLAVSKELGRVTLEFSGSWSNLNNLTQIQAAGTATWYPFGNLNLYSATSVTGFVQKSDKRLLLSQLLGWRVTPWFWAEGGFYWGDYTNANILYGQIVYNNSDAIKYRTSANLYFFAGKHLQFSLIWQYARKDSEQYYFTFNSSTKEVSPKPKIEYVPYNINSIIGGISWKF